MPYYFKLKSGIEANRLSITPLVGEPIYTKDQYILYIGDGQTPGGIPLKSVPVYHYIESSSSDVMLDDTDNAGVSIGSWNGILSVVQFKNSLSGACWMNFNLPYFWKNDLNVNVELCYILDSADYNKSVLLNLDYWIVNSNSSPNISVPTGSLTYNLISTPTNVNSFTVETPPSLLLSSQNINSNSYMVSIRFRRNGISTLDTYNGNFLLNKIIFKQEG